MRLSVGAAVAAVGLWMLGACTTSEPPPDAATPLPDAEPTGCDLTAADPPCVAWTVEPVVPPFAAGPQVVVASSGRELFAYAAAGGEELWRFAPPDDSLLGGAQVVEGGVVVTTTTPGGGEVDGEGEVLPVGTTCLLAPADGGQVWCAAGLATQAPATGGAVPLLVDGQVVVLDAPSGAELWRRPTSGLLGPTFEGGEALVGDEDGVALVAADDGSVRWRLELDRAGMAPGSGPGELAVGSALVTTPAGRLVVDRESGEVTADPADLPSGSLGVVGGAMVSWLRDSSVSGLSPAGETTWTQPGRPLLARGRTALVVGAESEGREFIGLLDAATGQVVWQAPADADAVEVVTDDTTVAVVRSGSVTVHARSTGDVLLRLTAPNPDVVALSPLVVATGDTLRVVTVPGTG